MAKSDGKMRRDAGMWPKILLLAIVALSLSACNRPPDLPSPPQSPSRPETRARNLVMSGMRQAIFSYSVRPDAFRQIEQPVAIRHPVLIT